MGVNGQNSLQEEEALLVSKLQSFQPNHLLNIKQEMNLVYNETGGSFYDSSKISKSEFEIVLKPFDTPDTVCWAGNLIVVSEKIFGDKIAPLSVHQAKYKVMSALMRNGYLRKQSELE